MLLTLGTLVGERKLEQRHPLAPWQAIGSAGWVQVVNHSLDSQVVRASAPEVDDAVRILGTVAPGGEVFLRLPYGDATVRVDVGGRWTEFKVSRPGVWRVDVAPAPVASAP